MANFLNTVSAVGALVMAATPLMAAASFAHAAEPQGVRIQVADLDLGRPGDVAKFEARVDRAADSFCSAMTTGSSLSDTPACRAAVREEAVAKLGASQRAEMQTASIGAGWQVAGE